MITKLRLNGWKSHLETEFDFSKGTNALIGIMGSGKSSIMQAVCFALFGTFPGLSSKKMEIGDIIMKKPVDKKSASVELEFEANGKNYQVKRVIQSGKTAEAEIREDGKLIDVSSKAVTRQVERILQIDYDLFSKAIYSEQDGLDYFLRIPKGKRMQQIDEMLKVDRFEAVRSESVSLKNRVIERHKERLKTIEDLRGKNIKGKISELENEIREKEKNKSQLETEVKSLEEKWKSSAERIREHEKNQKELSEREKEIEAVRARISEISKSLEPKKKKLKGVDFDEKTFESLEKNVKYLTTEISALETSLEETSGLINAGAGSVMFFENKLQEFNDMVKKGDELEMMITRAKKEIGENPEGFLQAIKNDLEEKRQKLYNLKASKLQEESNIQKLEGTDGRCPVCDSEVDELKKIKLISDKQANLDRIEKKIATINEFVVKDLMDIEKIEKSVFDIKVAEDFINGMKDRSELFETHKKEYEKVNEQLETLKSKKEKIQSDLEKLRKSLETKSAERERLANFADIGKEVDSLEKELAGQTYKEKLLADEIERINVKFRQIEISHMRTEYEGVIARKNSLEAEIKGIGEIIADKNSRLSELKKEEQTIASYVEETESYQKIAAMLDDFIETLKTTQEQLRSEFLVNVNSIMAHVWPELYPYGDFSEVRLVIDNDYVLQLNSSKGWVSADLVSGGERSLACLALRVAFSLAFAPNIKWLILDEPTHNLDANAIRKLGDTLKDKLDQFIDQVFLITHEEMLADSITGTLYKLEREKEKDAATKVVKI